MHLKTRSELFSVRGFWFSCCAVFFTGCANIEEQSAATATVVEQKSVTQQPTQCTGDVVAPPSFVPLLTEVDDPSLLVDSVKAENAGGLCQAKAYRVNQPFEIFRAWNSNNPGSEMGVWWSFSIPSGKISEYRKDFAICPAWSPLDMMTRCTIKEGAHLVLGTGQSAFCHEFLTYDSSPDIQIYVKNADEATFECKAYDGIFNWQESQ